MTKDEQSQVRLLWHTLRMIHGYYHLNWAWSDAEPPEDLADRVLEESKHVAGEEDK